MKQGDKYKHKESGAEVIIHSYHPEHKEVWLMSFGLPVFNEDKFNELFEKV